MKAHSEDLRRKIVAAVKRGAAKGEAAILFGTSLSSVKCFAKMEREGGSLAPRKPSGRPPKSNDAHASSIHQLSTTPPIIAHSFERPSKADIVRSYGTDYPIEDLNSLAGDALGCDLSTNQFFELAERLKF